MKHSLILMLLAGAACVGSAGSAAAPAPGRVYAYAAPTAAGRAARARDLLAAVAKHMRTLGSYDLRFVVETDLSQPQNPENALNISAHRIIISAHITD